MARGKSLSEEASSRVRARLQAIAAKYPNQRGVAHALGISQQSVSHILRGGHPGVDAALAVAAHVGESFEQIIGTDAPPLRTEPATVGSARLADELSAAGIDLNIAMRALVILANSLGAENNTLRARVAELESRTAKE